MNGFPTDSQQQAMGDASGRIATGVLTLYNRDGDKISDWNMDSAGANASTVLLKGSDTYPPSFYFGIVKRWPADTPSAMGSWEYKPASQPKGRSGIYIHQDFNQAVAPGTHGCIGILTNSSPETFDSELVSFGLEQQPDWDNTVSGAADPPNYNWKH